MTGPSISDLVAAKDPALDTEMRGKLDVTLAAMNAMAARAEGGEAYDQMIGEGNEAGNAAVQAAIDGLIDQTRSCLLYTSDAADERSSGDLGGSRVIKKKKVFVSSSP